MFHRIRKLVVLCVALLAGLASLPALAVDTNEQFGAGEPDGHDFDFSFVIEPALGTYTRIAERHELLLQIDLAFRVTPAEEERAVEIGRIALGYNLLLSSDPDWVELITEGFIDIPQGDEEVSGGVMAGFIFCLPPG